MNTIDDVAGLVSIGQLAKAAGVSSRTIRYYEELGILPEPRRTSGGTRKYPREYCGYIETALALKDLGFRLEEVKPLARLALGRTIAPGQRARAAQLVEDRIQALDRQVAVLRKLRECVDQPDGTVSLDPLALRNGSVPWPALCSLPVADPAAPRPATGTRFSEAGMTTGIILLVFIAALVTFFLTRARRRLGMGNATARTWLIIMTVVILAVLALYAYQTQGK
ncbi:MAG TPA: MerR family transcriptional regulator [Streptosporangiaceae bacterium]|jgi:DNA-binding transcriptional MerR regulator|nr:MerR family transcriptional regulator [Streptosporangiaceae bacterium]